MLLLKQWVNCFVHVILLLQFNFFTYSPLSYTCTTNIKTDISQEKTKTLNQNFVVGYKNCFLPLSNFIYLPLRNKVKVRFTRLKI